MLFSDGSLIKVFVACRQALICCKQYPVYANVLVPVKVGLDVPEQIEGQLLRLGLTIHLALMLGSFHLVCKGDLYGSSQQGCAGA